jgi:hypothetical protein
VDANVLGVRVKVACREDVTQGKLWAYGDPRRRLSKRKKCELDLVRLDEAYPELRISISQRTPRTPGPNNGSLCKETVESETGQGSLQLRPIDSKHKRHLNDDRMRVVVGRRWRKASKNFVDRPVGRAYLYKPADADRIAISRPSQ